MEPAAILEMVTRVPKRLFISESFTSDNDSTMKAQLQRKEDPANKKDKRKLPGWIEEPIFFGRSIVSGEVCSKTLL